MARPKDKLELKKHTLNLRDGDYEYLDQAFRPSGVAAAVAIRHIIANYVDKLRSQEPGFDFEIEVPE